jgi:hypothetical protein
LFAEAGRPLQQRRVNSELQASLVLVTVAKNRRARDYRDGSGSGRVEAHVEWPFEICVFLLR